MQYMLPRDVFDVLVETFKSREKAEKFARAIEDIINFSRDKSKEEISQKKEHLKIELKEELKMLKNLNQKISDEAQNLTNALKKDNKQQGNWGEMILSKVLESSGLR